jgi:hypothetical protein
MIRRSMLAAALLTATAIVWAAPALAASDPAPTAPTVTGGRWVFTGADSVPFVYWQGLTHDTQRHLYFIGVFEGGSRTSDTLVQQQRVEQLIPKALTDSVGFNHIGDPTFDAAGGRIILPMECYDPTATGAQPSNTCGMGGFGVLDPKTLAFKYWVRLDQADIPKAMWAEIDPQGKLVWTSAGDDLLAYRVSDISTAHAASAKTSTPIKPVKRLKNTVPAGGISGGAFYDGRLLLSGQDGDLIEISSVDLTGKTPTRLELGLPGVRAESEGLDIVDARGGLLHFLFSSAVANPTFGSGHNELLTFIPKTAQKLRLKLSPKSVRVGRATSVSVTVGQTWADTLHPVAGATVTIAGKRATTNAKGHAKLKVKAVRKGSVKVRATKAGLPAGSATIRARK